MFKKTILFVTNFVEFVPQKMKSFSYPPMFPKTEHCVKKNRKKVIVICNKNWTDREPAKNSSHKKVINSIQ